MIWYKVVPLLSLILLNSCNCSKPILTLSKSEGELIYLNFNEFITEINKTSLIILTSSTCIDCKKVNELILKPFVDEHKVSLNLFKINELNQEELEIINYTFKNKRIYYKTIPFMFIVKDGKYINSESDYNYFMNFLKEYTFY